MIPTRQYRWFSYKLLLNLRNVFCVRTSIKHINKYKSPYNIDNNYCHEIPTHGCDRKKEILMKNLSILCCQCNTTLKQFENYSTLFICVAPPFIPAIDCARNIVYLRHGTLTVQLLPPKALSLIPNSMEPQISSSLNDT